MSMRRLWRILLLVGAAFALAALSGSARASFGGGNGKILFIDSATGTLRAIDPSGAHDDTVQLPAGVGAAMIPTWAPDGRSLAFVSHPGTHAEDPFDLYVRMDNGDAFVAASCDDDLGSISWSPDGTKLMYTCQGWWAAIASVDGSSVGSLLDLQASDVSWSPDGSRIAYDRFDGSIWVSNLDGSNAIELRAPTSSSCGTSIAVDGPGPRWSPDGSMVADDCLGLSVYRTDGSGSWPIDRNGTWPTWAPDGTKLAYVKWFSSSNDFGIVTVGPMGGGEHTILAPGAENPSELDWGRTPPQPRTTEPPREIAPPAITGTAVYQGHLVGSVGTWGGDPVRELRYQWQRCDAEGANCIAVLGGDWYAPIADDVGHRIRLVVTVTNTAGTTTASAITDTVGRGTLPAPIAPVVTGRPSIAGTARIGSVLTAAPGAWNGDPPMTYTFQWQRCDATAVNCQAMAGATDQTYAVKAADAGSRLRVAVTASNDGGRSTSGSDATDLVAPLKIPPAIRSAHASWTHNRIAVKVTACSNAGKSLSLTATDATVAHAKIVGKRTLTWSLTSCTPTVHRWAANRRGVVHVITIRVRDADGLWSKIVRMQLR
jgi:hypothetical protein